MTVSQREEGISYELNRKVFFRRNEMQKFKQNSSLFFPSGTTSEALMSSPGPLESPEYEGSDSTLLQDGKWGKHEQFETQDLI